MKKHLLHFIYISLVFVLSGGIVSPVQSVVEEETEPEFKIIKASIFSSQKNVAERILERKPEVKKLGGTYHATTSAVVRDWPSDSNKEIRKISARSTFKVTGETKDWLRLERNEWIKKSVAKKGNPPAIVQQTLKLKSSGSSSGGGTSSKGGYLWTDNIAGWVKGLTVPCGGLYRYQNKNFFAREIMCPGSQRYHSLKKGDKIKIASKKCTVVGFQNLNYNKHTMDHVRWIGNTIVQTCYRGRKAGDVKMINFNCH